MPCLGNSKVINLTFIDTLYISEVYLNPRKREFDLIPTERLTMWHYFDFNTTDKGTDTHKGELWCEPKNHIVRTEKSLTEWGYSERGDVQFTVSRQIKPRIVEGLLVGENTVLWL